MITEVVTFKLPANMTRDEVVAAFRKSAPTWSANPDLIRKNYLYDAEKGVGGGVYLWKSIEDAKRWHGEAFRKRVLDLYGAEPSFAYFETPILVDNAAGQITEDAAGGVQEKAA